MEQLKDKLLEILKEELEIEHTGFVHGQYITIISGQEEAVERILKEIDKLHQSES